MEGAYAPGTGKPAAIRSRTSSTDLPYVLLSNVDRYHRLYLIDHESDVRTAISVHLNMCYTGASELSLLGVALWRICRAVPGNSFGSPNHHDEEE